MTKMDVVDGYEISWHFYINLLPIRVYIDCAFTSKIELLLNSLTISSY